MQRIYPDLEWYSEQSTARGLPVRCPFANAHACPRHYQSLSLLGNTGLTTKIEPSLDQTLLRKWQKSTLWPVVDEQGTTVINNNYFWNFCPEVAFDVFRLFSSSLSRYADDIDKHTAEVWLVNHGFGLAKDWRWDWANVTEMHYSECPLYSQLPYHSGGKSPETRGEIVTLKPGMFGLSVDLKHLLTRFSRWWLSRNGKAD